MFGALAVLVCLVKLGADVSLKVTMSVEDILGTTEPGRCYHDDMTARDLMEAVPQAITEHWSSDCQTGWSCILHVLGLAKLDTDQMRADELERDTGDTEDDDSEGDDSESDDSNISCELEGILGYMDAHNDWLLLPCGKPKLGTLWAAIQVELLTYRRVEDGGPWMSDYFLMDALKTWLEGKSEEFCTPLVKRGMMKNHTCCGWFHGAPDFVCPVAEEVCSEYFMNMDIYNRTSYLGQPNFTRALWYHTEAPEHIPSA